jgi:hypothetical protein
LILNHLNEHKIIKFGIPIKAIYLPENVWLVIATYIEGSEKNK